MPVEDKPTKGQRYASQQNWPADDAVGQKRKSSERANVVRFIPESGQTADVSICPLCAKSGHMQCSNFSLIDQKEKRLFALSLLFQIALKAHAPSTATSSSAVHHEGARARAPNAMIAKTRKII